MLGSATLSLEEEGWSLTSILKEDRAEPAFLGLGKEGVGGLDSWSFGWEGLNHFESPREELSGHLRYIGVARIRGRGLDPKLLEERVGLLRAGFPKFTPCVSFSLALKDDRFQLEEFSPRRVRIRLSDARLEDEGGYFCQLYTEDTHHQIATLTVLGNRLPLLIPNTSAYLLS